MRSVAQVRLLFAALCALGAFGALAAGCGQTTQEQADQVVSDYVEARAAGDFARVCTLFSDSFKRELGVGENCAAEIEKQASSGSVSDIRIVDVRVRDNRALADLDVRQGPGHAGRISLLLEQSGGKWQITGLQ